VAGKARVHELAKELGVTSKQVLARLSEQGEFVKSASSTVEAPVARRLRESFGGSKPSQDKTSGNGAAAAKPAAKSAAPAAKPAAPKPAAPPAPEPPAPPPPAPAPAGPAPEQPQAGPTPDTARPGPTPGPRPAAPKPAARRQQSVLFGAAGGAGYSASAGAAPRCACASSRCPAPWWCFAGQHAAASRWRQSSAASRRSSTRSRWQQPSGRPGRWSSRWWRRRRWR
jgi:hypothetical protein